MISIETDLAGAFVINVEPREDERGLLQIAPSASTDSRIRLQALPAHANPVQKDLKDTLRGMHFPVPAGDTTLCEPRVGANLDIIVDLGPESPMCRRHVASALIRGNQQALNLLESFPHGTRC